MGCANRRNARTSKPGFGTSFPRIHESEVNAWPFSLSFSGNPIPRSWIVFLANIRIIFQLSPTFAVVSSSGVSGSVAEGVGIKGENKVEGASGVVFKLSSAYSGYTVSSLWEWLGEHGDEL